MSKVSEIKLDPAIIVFMEKKTNVLFVRALQSVGPDVLFLWIKTILSLPEMVSMNKPRNLG